MDMVCQEIFTLWKGPGPWTWSVQEIFTPCRGPGPWTWSVQVIFTPCRGLGPWTWSVQVIFTLWRGQGHGHGLSRDIYPVEGARAMHMVCARDLYHV